MVAPGSAKRIGAVRGGQFQLTAPQCGFGRSGGLDRQAPMSAGRRAGARNGLNVGRKTAVLVSSEGVQSGSSHSPQCRAGEPSP
jgi:hypothetical protein